GSAGGRSRAEALRRRRRSRRARRRVRARHHRSACHPARAGAEPLMPPALIARTTGHARMSAPSACFRTGRLLLAAAVAALLAAPVAVLAQAQPPAAGERRSEPTIVRTNREQTLVWSRNPSRVIATLPQGVVLEALSRDAQWLEVLVPETHAGPGGAIGYVFEGHVEMVSGPPVPDRPQEQAPYAAPPPHNTGAPQSSFS